MEEDKKSEEGHQSSQKLLIPKQILERFQACMVLSAVGDSMGYKNGDWEFNTSSKIIHEQMLEMTKGKGPNHLKIDMSWKYSDDTVMHIATADALLKTSTKYLCSNKPKTGVYEDFEWLEKIGKNLGKYYKASGNHMSGRAPGKTCMRSMKIIESDGTNWNKVPYSDRGGGCGGAMRSSCIGLFYGGVYLRAEDLQDSKQRVKVQKLLLQKLISVSIESGRVTHHNPVGYLGAMVAAYFTFLTIRNISPKLWIGYLLQEAFPLSEVYIKRIDRESQLNLNSKSWKRFIQGWKNYAKIRNLSSDITDTDKSSSEPSFPSNYGVIERQHFYKQISFGHWAGATGFDSVLIAYDAILSSKGSWEQFCLRGILHGGDNDSTGAIGGAWFGALYGFQGVPKCHYKQVEDSSKLMRLGEALSKHCREFEFKSNST